MAKTMMAQRRLDNEIAGAASGAYMRGLAFQLPGFPRIRFDSSGRQYSAAGVDRHFAKIVFRLWRFLDEVADLHHRHAVLIQPYGKPQPFMAGMPDDAAARIASYQFVGGGVDDRPKVQFYRVGGRDRDEFAIAEAILKIVDDRP
ncbi:hypothetical protein [Mesorhizobium sp. B1-1-5]|uniref:hypothetical protein n=1 Tax=Mesorhizobium sp. B1-1-5 TaxID=2589979 RepID=UPI00112723FD|nr:hypothetical protein [Mesorhizobium sp. B1-1-5]TPO13672.1 hypothetical protein FJ980_00355 [Mesorhizobium sp. B1-1-5]